MVTRFRCMDRPDGNSTHKRPLPGILICGSDARRPGTSSFNAGCRLQQKQEQATWHMRWPKKVKSKDGKDSTSGLPGSTELDVKPRSSCDGVNQNTMATVGDATSLGFHRPDLLRPNQRRASHTSRIAAVCPVLVRLNNNTFGQK